MCTWQVSIGVKQKILTPIQKRSLKNFLAHNDEKGSIFWFLKKTYSAIYKNSITHCGKIVPTVDIQTT